MTPPHTPESLLALTKSPEGLEQLRIIAAELDGEDPSYQCEYHGTVPDDRVSDGMKCPWCRSYVERECPNYPTSLDTIFAAEERLGLHDRSNKNLRLKWFDLLQYTAELTLVGNVYTTPRIEVTDLVALPPCLRLIPLILTAQWKEQNP